jgi:hypothetical protein
MYLDRVLEWPEEDQQAWASRKMDDITDAHALALHIAGWKIVSRDDPNNPAYTEYQHLGGVTPKWPFGSKKTGCVCPAWCDDMRPKANVIPLTNANGKDQPA